MKTLIKTGMIAVMVAFFAVSCKKDPGTGGKKTIKGTVTYPGGAAASAIVSIKYDATDGSAGTFDATATADGSGNYTIENLTRGNYYIDAQYTDAYGMVYNTAGTHVLIDKKKGELTVDFSLQ